MDLGWKWRSSGSRVAIRLRDSVRWVLKDAREVGGGAGWMRVMSGGVGGDVGLEVALLEGSEGSVGYGTCRIVESTISAVRSIGSSTTVEGTKIRARFAIGDALWVVSCEEDTGGRLRFREVLDVLDVKEGCESGITLGGVSQESENERRCTVAGIVSDEGEGAVFGREISGVRPTRMLVEERIPAPCIGLWREVAGVRCAFPRSCSNRPCFVRLSSSRDCSCRCVRFAAEPHAFSGLDTATSCLPAASKSR